MANIVIRTRANIDILQNVDVMIRHVSARSASRWMTLVQKALKALANNPEQHAEADEAAELGINLRFKMIGRRPHIFRILYVYNDKTVTVIRILHAAQDRLTEDDL